MAALYNKAERITQRRRPIDAGDEAALAATTGCLRAERGLNHEWEVAGQSKDFVVSQAVRRATRAVEISLEVVGADDPKVGRFDWSAMAPHRVEQFPDGRPVDAAIGEDTCERLARQPRLA